MLLIIYFLLFSAVGLAQKSKFQPYSAHIDSVEDGQFLTVFNRPGMNWSTCTTEFDKVTKAEKCKEAVGWPSRDAKIRVISAPVKARVFNPYIEEDVDENYVKVEFEYERIGKDGKLHHQKGEGYIELDYLSRSAHNPFYGAQKKACLAEKKIVMKLQILRQG